MSSHCTKTCDPCARKGNPDQRQISRSGQKTTLKVKSSSYEKNASFVWQVSYDSGCNYQLIPHVEGPSYTFIPTPKDSGNLYKVIITEPGDDKRKSSSSSKHSSHQKDRRSTQIILLSLETSWVNHTVYVDSKFGSDLTGQLENLLLPFQTIEAAIQAILCSKVCPSSEHRWCIRVRCGDYPINNDLWLPGFISISGSGIEDTTLHVNSFIGFDGTLNPFPGSGPVIENLTVEGGNQPVIQTTGGEYPDNGDRPHGITLRNNRVIRNDRPGLRFNQLIWRPGTPGTLAFNTATLAGGNTPIDIEANSLIVYNTGGTKYGFQNVAVIGDVAGSNMTNSSVSLDLDANTNAEGQPLATAAQASMAVLYLFDPPRVKTVKLKNNKAEIKAMQIDEPGRIKYAGAIMAANIIVKSEQLSISTATRQANIETSFTGIAVGDADIVDINATYTDTDFTDDVPPFVLSWGSYGSAQVSSNFADWSTDFIPPKFTDNILATLGTLPSDFNNSIDGDTQADLAVDGEITSNGGVNIQGGLCGRVRTVSANTVLAADDYIILVDTTAAPVQVTLPNPPPCQGKTYYIKNIGDPANNVNIIGRVDNVDNPSITMAYQAIQIASNDDTTNQWWGIGRFDSI